MPVTESAAASHSDDRSKRAWRASLRARRATLPDHVLADEAAMLADAATAMVTAMAADDALDEDRTVCAYAPRPPEPGSLAIAERLHAAGCRVLLPVTGEGPLRWAVFTTVGSMTEGRFGIAEPTGPRLAAATVARARLVLVPALAVDRSGTRLGRGGGYYDRTLALVAGGTRVVAVVRDEELVDELPRDSHDVSVSGVLTPRRGFVALPD